MFLQNVLEMHYLLSLMYGFFMFNFILTSVENERKTVSKLNNMPYDNIMHKTFIRKMFTQKKIEIFYKNVTLLNPSNLW